MRQWSPVICAESFYRAAGGIEQRNGRSRGTEPACTDPGSQANLNGSRSDLDLDLHWLLFRNISHARDTERGSHVQGQPDRPGRPQAQTRRPCAGFRLRRGGPAIVKLADTAGKARLFNVVPSLDTPVCNKQTKRFAEELTALGSKVAAYTVSLDLPFAQTRFCTEAKIENLSNLSDAHNQSFGVHYGVLIQGLPIPLLARSVFVVDPSNTITYVEIVPEIAQEPDYEPALKALKAAAGA